MNLRDLEYLVALADHHHFGRAAAACYVSQPTLSTQVKKLEQELGVALVERNPRSVLLTDAGVRVVERARVVLDEVNGIRTIAQRSADPESGSLKLGLFPTLAPYLLPHVVPTIHERFPRLELLLVEEKTETLLARLADGNLDAALLALPVPVRNLVVDPLFTEDFVLAVPHDHPLARQSGPIDARALADEPMLLLEEGHCLRDQALEVCALNGASERRGFRATSLETLRQMVGTGVGITLLPELAIHTSVAEPDSIAIRRIAPPTPARTIAMLWRPTSMYQDLLPEIAATIARLARPLVSHDLPSEVGGEAISISAP